MKRIPLLLILGLAAAACGPRWLESEGRSYDFAYGLDWGGVIDDARVRKYRK